MSDSYYTNGTVEVTCEVLKLIELILDLEKILKVESTKKLKQIL